MKHHKPHIFCWQKTHQTPLRHPPPSRNTGEVPNLFAPDERVQVCEMVRAAARAEGKAPEARVKRGFWKDECMDQRPKGLELTMNDFFLGNVGDMRFVCYFWGRPVDYFCIWGLGVSNLDGSEVVTSASSEGYDVEEYHIFVSEYIGMKICCCFFCGCPVFRLLGLMIEGWIQHYGKKEGTNFFGPTLVLIWRMHFAFNLLFEPCV